MQMNVVVRPSGFIEIMTLDGTRGVVILAKQHQADFLESIGAVEPDVPPYFHD